MITVGIILVFFGCVTGTIDLVLLRSLSRNAFDRNSKISEYMRINDKLPEYLLRHAYTAIETFIVDQETYNAHPTHAIVRYKMEHHCSIYGRFYETIEQLQKSLVTDVLIAIAVDNIHSYHHLRAIILELTEIARVVNDLCAVYAEEHPSIAKKRTTWSLEYFMIKLRNTVDNADHWIQSTSDEMKLASRALHGEFLCRRTLKVRAKAIQQHLNQTLPRLSWSVICREKSDDDGDYTDYTNQGEFNNVTAGLHAIECTAFGAVKADSPPPIGLLEKIEACMLNFQRMNATQYSNSSTEKELRILIGNSKAETVESNRIILFVVAKETKPGGGGLGVYVDLENYREFIIRRPTGAIAQRILIGWQRAKREFDEDDDTPAVNNHETNDHMHNSATPAVNNHETNDHMHNFASTAGLILIGNATLTIVDGGTETGNETTTTTAVEILQPDHSGDELAN